MLIIIKITKKVVGVWTCIIWRIRKGRNDLIFKRKSFEWENIFEISKFDFGAGCITFGYL